MGEMEKPADEVCDTTDNEADREINAGSINELEFNPAHCHRRKNGDGEDEFRDEPAKDGKMTCGKNTSSF
jgi:hypothetical protein